MNLKTQIEKLKKSATLIAFFKGSTDDIDEVISFLGNEEYHTPKQYNELSEKEKGQTHSD